MRYLAIDYGQKRTGLAVCDADETMAWPLDVLSGQKDLSARIGEIVSSYQIEAIVIGLPLNMDGSEGAAAKEVRQLAKELQVQTGLEVFFQDERLSSFGAERKMASANLRRKKRRKHLDAVAAAEILQEFLDTKKR